MIQLFQNHTLLHDEILSLRWTISFKQHHRNWNHEIETRLRRETEAMLTNKAFLLLIILTAAAEGEYGSHIVAIYCHLFQGRIPPIGEYHSWWVKIFKYSFALLTESKILIDPLKEFQICFSRVSPSFAIRSDEGLTSAWKTLYGSYSCYKTELSRYIPPPTQHNSFFRNLPR